MTIDPRGIKGRAVGVYTPPEPEQQSKTEEAETLFGGGDQFKAVGPNKWKAQISGIQMPDVNTDHSVLDDIGNAIEAADAEAPTTFGAILQQSGPFAGFMHSLYENTKQLGSMDIANLTKFPRVADMTAFIQETGGNAREIKEVLKLVQDEHTLVRAKLYEKQDAIHQQLQVVTPGTAKHLLADLRKVEQALVALAREEDNLQAAWTHLL